MRELLDREAVSIHLAEGQMIRMITTYCGIHVESQPVLFEKDEAVPDEIECLNSECKRPARITIRAPFEREE